MEILRTDIRITDARLSDAIHHEKGLTAAPGTPQPDDAAGGSWDRAGVMKTKLPFITLLLGVLALPSCVTTTAPDGTAVERVDQEAVNPWLLLARDLFGPKGDPTPAK